MQDSARYYTPKTLRLQCGKPAIVLQFQKPELFARDEMARRGDGAGGVGNTR